MAPGEKNVSWENFLRVRKKDFWRSVKRLFSLQRSILSDARISVASDILEKNRDRKNRKNAEKMAIRVERSISGEGDGQEDRIAASSAKCKENKAGWSFYQGHLAEIHRNGGESMQSY